MQPSDEFLCRYTLLMAALAAQPLPLLHRVMQGPCLPPPLPMICANLSFFMTLVPLLHTPCPPCHLPSSATWSRALQPLLPCLTIVLWHYSPALVRLKLTIACL